MVGINEGRKVGIAVDGIVVGNAVGYAVGSPDGRVVVGEVVGEPRIGVGRNVGKVEGVEGR
jgi:hypothetical protein